MAAPTYVVNKNGETVPLAGSRRGRLLVPALWWLVVINVIQTIALIYMAVT